MSKSGVREDAILTLLICASKSDPFSLWIDQVADSKAAAQLAHRALEMTPVLDCNGLPNDHHYFYTDATRLLEAGWNPGDKYE